MRAIFNEANNELRAGSFARIRVAANAVTDQIIVPDRAIGTDLKNRFVLTIGENNILAYRLIEIGERYGKLRAVTHGLKSGDIIAVNGPARVGPGMPITPNPVSIDATNIAFTLSELNKTNLIAKH